MAFHNAAQFLPFFRFRHFFQIDEFLVAVRRLQVQHVGRAAGHAGREVAAHGAQDDDGAAGHVFAAMVPDAFDDGRGTAVADAEPFAGLAVDVDLAARGAEAGHVADDDVFRRRKVRFPRREHGDPAARQAFAQVIVGVAFQQQRQPFRDEGAEALARAAHEGKADRVFGQALVAVAPEDFAAQQRACHAVRVIDAQARADLFLFLQGGLAHAHQLALVQGLLDFVVLGRHKVMALRVYGRKSSLSRLTVAAFQFVMFSFCLRRS